GRLSTFDPSLYHPRMQLNSEGFPVGPPVEGFVQAENVIPAYEVPGLPRVGKRILRSVDPNNFAPRIGFSYSPFHSKPMVVRGGWGVFYSRASFVTLLGSLSNPPYFITGRRGVASFADPFVSLPSHSQFPKFVDGINLVATVSDRNIRTPY